MGAGNGGQQQQGGQQANPGQNLGIVGSIIGGEIARKDSSADKAAEAQRASLLEALNFQRASVNQARGDLQPFVAPGTASISPLLEAILGQGAGNQFFDQQFAENQRLQTQKDENDAKREKLQGELDEFKRTTSGGRRSKIKQSEMQAAISAIPEIRVPFIGERPDPGQINQTLTDTSVEGVLNNPFFQALGQEQDQRLLAQQAALGLGGSGGTSDALARQQLLLGNKFQQQAVQNRQQEIGNIFNLLSGGQAAAAGQANITTGTTPGIVSELTGLGDIEAGRLLVKGAKGSLEQDIFSGIGSMANSIGSFMSRGGTPAGGA